MLNRAVLLTIVGLALQGCAKDDVARSRDVPTAKGSGSAKPPGPPVVALPAVAPAVAQPATAAAYVIVKADGSLAVATAPAEIAPALELAAVKADAAVTLAELPAKLAAIYEARAQAHATASGEDPPPEEPAEGDQAGGTGTAMALDEGKMGKKDSDRAEGQYKMKNNNTDPALAREQALAAAKEAGVLGVLAEQQGGAFASITGGPCDVSSGFDDRDIQGGLLGDEGGMQGGWGYGVSGTNGAGGSGGTIGTGHYGTIGHGRGYGGGGGEAPPIPAGLRGRALMDGPICGTSVPLVIADAAAPAARLVEVLTALPNSQLAVTTDGGAHAQTLAIAFGFRAGTRPGTALELAFTLRPDGVHGAAARGATADEQLWTWRGDASALADAYAKARAVSELADQRGVRLRVDGDLTAGGLIAALATLLQAGALEVAIGEPVDVRVGGLRSSGSAAVPAVRIGQPSVTGDGDQASIRRYLKRNLPKLRYCYEKELLAHPGLEGEVLAKFLISPKGTVESSEASGVSPEVSSCIAGVTKAIEFPKPKGGGAVMVSYPLDCRSTGG